MENKSIIITDEIREAIATLVYYDYDDEAKHYEENDKPEGHVFESIKVLEKLLNEIDKK